MDGGRRLSPDGAIYRAPYGANNVLFYLKMFQWKSESYITLKVIHEKSIQPDRIL